ncbi:MAG: hypothetical protein IJX96_03820 [Clostridia bacterium]|nr:hypothetical protein [Clostridia bacterium]
MKVKRIYVVSAIIAIVLAVAVFAFGFTPVTATVQAETVMSEQTEIVQEQTETGGQVHTVWTRIEEFFSLYFLEFTNSIDLAGVVACIVTIVIEIKSNKKHKKEINDALSANSDTTEANTASNDKVLEATNTLIDKQNEHEEKEARRDAVNEQTIVYERAILEILVAVYANNKNLPQAVKDLVNLKYVSALQTELVAATGDKNETEESSEG